MRIKPPTAFRADASPLAYQQRTAEQVGPHLEPIESAFVALRPNAGKRGVLREQRQLDQSQFQSPFPDDLPRNEYSSGDRISSADRGEISENQAQGKRCRMRHCRRKGPPQNAAARLRRLRPCPASAEAAGGSGLQSEDLKGE